MVKLVNRAKMSTATTGTGTITLGSAESGYQSFADAGVADGEAVRYVIEDGTAWEIGTGTYTASGTTLSRSVEESSNSGAAINLSGSAVVYVTATFDDIVQPRENLIINGNFDIWQRGASGTAGYVADRWKNDIIGSTAAISRQSFTLGQTDVPNEPRYFHRVTVTSVAGAGNLVVFQQLIESVRTFAGQTVTLSFWAKADASKNIAVELEQSFGTGGSPSSNVAGIGVTTCSLTTSWQKFTVTASFPSISGKTLGSNGNDAILVNFWLDAGSNFDSRTNSLGQQSGTFDIAQVKLEPGDTATDFVPRRIEDELAKCQRYYEIGRSGVGARDGGDVSITIEQFRTTKRTAPTIATTVVVGSGSATISAPDAFGFAWFVTPTSAYGVIDYTADAEL